MRPFLAVIALLVGCGRLGYAIGPTDTGPGKDAETDADADTDTDADAEAETDANADAEADADAETDADDETDADADTDTDASSPDASPDAESPDSGGDAGPIRDVQLDSIFGAAIGGGGTERALGVAVAADGDLYVVGYFEGSGRFGESTLMMATAGDRDGFVARYSPLGELRWVRTVGSTGRDELTSICVTGAGDAIVGGYVSADASSFAGPISATRQTGIVLSVDATGTGALLDVFTATNNALVAGVAITERFSVAVGSFQGALDSESGARSSLGGSDGFVRFYFDVPRTMILGGAGFDAATAVAVRGATIAVAGSFNGMATLPSGPRTATSGQDAYVALFETNGAPRADVAFGGTGADAGLSVTLDDAENVYLGGYFSSMVTFGSDAVMSNGGWDAFVASTTRTGTPRGLQSFGGSLADMTLGLSFDATASRILAAGYASGGVPTGAPLTIRGANDGFLVRYGTDSSVVDAYVFGGDAFDVAFGSAASPSGDAYAVGYVQGEADFAGTSHMSGALDDIGLLHVPP